MGSIHLHDLRPNEMYKSEDRPYEMSYLDHVSERYYFVGVRNLKSYWQILSEVILK